MDDTREPPAEVPDPDEVDDAGESFERPIDRFRRSGAGSVIAAGLLPDLALTPALRRNPSPELRKRGQG